MAALPDEDRNRIWRHFMRRNAEALPVTTKTDIREAVDACDTWLDSNLASLNAALPAAFRLNATPTQKALLLGYTAMRRAGGLHVDEDG